MVKMTTLRFAVRVKEERLRKGWSQEQVAEHVGTTRQNISRWERGETIPGPHFRQQLSAVFERSVEELGLLPTGAYAPVAHRAELEAPTEPHAVLQHHPAPVSRSAERETTPGTPRTMETASAPISSSSPPHNLPSPPTPLIGRAAEVVRACELLCEPAVRLVTLCGPPGVGKTRLALDVAKAALPHFPDGVFFVSLAPLRDPGLVTRAIAQAVGVAERLDQGAQPPAEALSACLRDQQVLLVLDNFEHLAPATSLVAELLAHCPGLKVLVTSRAALHVRGEREIPVPPLALPDPANLPPVAALAQVPSVALFVERARAVTPDFALTEKTGASVAAICQRLDGLPLAIELAAARVRLLSPEMLLARLERRLPLLTSGPSDLPERQQTLRATLAWSYHLLTPTEQALFRRLAVCIGGCTLAAAEAICPAAGTLGGETGETGEILDGLSALLDHHLLSREPAGPAGTDDSEPRIGMLETIREYAQEQLAASGEASATQQAHAAYYLALAEKAAPLLKEAEQGKWLARLEREHANLYAALTWAVEGAEVEIAVRLAAALVGFWRMHGHVGEGRIWLERVLPLAPTAADPSLVRAHAKVINGLGLFAYRQGDLVPASIYFEKSLELWRRIGDTSAVATVLNNLGIVAHWQDDFPLAERRYAESLAAHRLLHDAAQDMRGIAMVLSNLAEVLRFEGAYDRARQLCEESLSLRRQMGERWGIAITLGNLGDIAREMGKADRAAELYEESLALLRELGASADLIDTLIGMANLARDQGDVAQSVALCEECLEVARRVSDRRGMAAALLGLGHVAREQGDEARALTLYREALDLYQQVGSKRGIVCVVEGVAVVRCAQGYPQHATRLLGAAAALRETISIPLPPVECAVVERTVAQARAALTRRAFAVAWARGQAMPIEAVIAEALAGTKTGASDLDAQPPDVSATADKEVLHLHARRSSRKGASA